MIHRRVVCQHCWGSVHFTCQVWLCSLFDLCLGCCLRLSGHLWWTRHNRPGQLSGGWTTPAYAYTALSKGLEPRSDAHCREEAKQRGQKGHTRDVCEQPQDRWARRAVKGALRGRRHSTSCEGAHEATRHAVRVLRVRWTDVNLGALG